MRLHRASPWYLRLLCKALDMRCVGKKGSF
jgi:hypothetical protein